MSKVSKLSKIKKGAEKVIHTTPLKLWIQSGMAAPGPPLGPQLGQVLLFLTSWPSFLSCFLERGEHWPILQRIQ